MDTLLGNLTPKEAIPVTETISNIQDAVKDLYGATRAKALPIMPSIEQEAPLHVQGRVPQGKGHAFLWGNG